MYILCRYKNFQNLPPSLTVLKNGNAKFKAYLRKYLHTHSFCSIDECCMCEDDLWGLFSFVDVLVLVVWPFLQKSIVICEVCYSCSISKVILLCVVTPYQYKCCGLLFKIKEAYGNLGSYNWLWLARIAYCVLLNSRDINVYFLDMHLKTKAVFKSLDRNYYSHKFTSCTAIVFVPAD
jgi:hypothetical protein